MADINEKKPAEAHDALKTKPVMQTANEAVQRGGAAVEQASHAGADALRQTSDTAAQLAQRNNEAGLAAMRQLTEATEGTARRGVQLMAEGQQKFMQTAAQRMQESGRKMAEAIQGTAQDMRTLMVLPTHMAGGNIEELQQSMMGLVQGVIQTNLKAAEEMFRAADPSTMFQIQQRFVHDYLDALMQGSAAVVRSVRTAADRTLQPLEQQFEQRRYGHGHDEARMAAE